MDYLNFNMEASYIYIAIGIALVFFGRKLYWLSVGVLGFLAGMYFSIRFFPGHPGWMAYIIGAGFGILGAIAAVVLQKIAVAALGFVAGGFFLANIVQDFHLMTEHSFIVPFLVGGVLGAILVYYMFEWALIISSSIGGAYLIVRDLHISNMMQSIFIAAIAVVGALVQAQMRKSNSGKRRSRRADREKKRDDGVRSAA